MAHGSQPGTQVGGREVIEVYFVYADACRDLPVDWAVCVWWCVGSPVREEAGGGSGVCSSAGCVVYVPPSVTWCGWWSDPCWRVGSGLDLIWGWIPGPGPLG